MINKEQKLNNNIKPHLHKANVGSSALSVVYKTCGECYGQVDGFSKCCDAEAINGRCTYCNKFCKTYPCTECEGFSPFEIRIGDEVEIYVYKNSPTYLKEQFKGGRFQKGKFYRGKVKNIINKETIEVKLSSRLVNVKIDDVDVC
jgi:hypothetical protein